MHDPTPECNAGRIEDHRYLRETKEIGVCQHCGHGLYGFEECRSEVADCCDICFDRLYEECPQCHEWFSHKFLTDHDCPFEEEESDERSETHPPTLPE
jgi:hypothetical protein